MSARRFGVIGWPLGHTLSPAFQQAALDALGLRAEYVAAATPPAQLKARLGDVRAGAWDGLNVTIPHKATVATLVDRRTAAATRTGAVNTVIRDGAGLLGDNTDPDGFLRALTTYGGFDPAGVPAVVLGAGGAARAVVWALAQAGAADLVVANRTRARADDLVAAVGSDTGTPVRSVDGTGGELRDAIAQAGLLVNTTSLGMAGGPAPAASPIPAAWLRPQLFVHDIVYRPAVTPLLAAAAATGCATLGGIEMLVLQGAASLERWTDRTAPVDIMLQAARTALAAALPIESAL